MRSNCGCSRAVEAGEEAKADGTPHADRLDALNTKVSVLTASSSGKGGAARATNAIAAASRRASGAKKCEKMTACFERGSRLGGDSTGAQGSLGASKTTTPRTSRRVAWRVRGGHHRVEALSYSLRAVVRAAVGEGLFKFLSRDGGDGRGNADVVS